MDDYQLLRYSRHILLPQIDVDGQQAILNARVLVIGLGGLGSPVALYLAASGVGNLVLVDDDLVELSNLQRQIAHQTTRCGINKASSAKQSSLALNSHVNIETIERRLDDDAMVAQIKLADVVVDCSDNLTTRLQVNRLCWQAKKPLVSGAAIAFEGQLMVVDSRQIDTPCYQCLYDETSDAQLNCAQSGVIAPLVGVIGSLQALETLKIITGLTDVSQLGKLHLYDALSSSWRAFKFPKKTNCPVCGSP